MEEFINKMHHPAIGVAEHAGEDITVFVLLGLVVEGDE